MFEQKENYHHQKDKQNVSNSKEENPNVYHHYYNNQTKQRPQSEKMNKDMKRIQQDKQSLNRQIENEKMKRELYQERRNLNSAGLDQGDKVKGCLAPNSDIDWHKREKEKERMKKLEYNQELKRQIEEKNHLKEIENQKRREEEMKYESKFKQNIDSMQPQIINKSSDKLKLQSLNSISYNPTNIPMSNQLYPIHEEPSSLQSSGLSQQSSTNNQYNGIPHTQLYFYPNNQYCDNYYKELANIPQSCPQQYLPNRPMTTYNMNYPQTMPMRVTDSMQLQTRTNNQNYYILQPQPPQQTGMPVTVENLFHNFVNDQINVISDYESKVENFDETHYDNKDVIGTLTKEKLVTMEKIKQEQDKISTCLGFYPMQNEYNNKITNLLNMILESKIEKIQQKRLIASTNNLVSTTYIPIYTTQPETLSSNVYKSNPNICSNYNPNSIPIQKQSDLNMNICSQQSPIISNVGYKSKYENFVKQSIINAEDVNPEFKQSLIGFSKFVSANNNNISTINNPNTSSFLMQTWKENDMEDNSSNKKTNLSQIKEEEVKYNIPQAQILMTNSDSEENKDNNLKLKSYQYMNGNSSENKDISVILPSPINNGNNYNDKNNMNFDIINNNDISAIGEIGKFNVSHMDDSLIKGMKISKEEKDKTLIFRQNNDNEISNSNLLFNSYIEGDNNNDNQTKITNKLLNEDDINDQCNMSMSLKSKEDKLKNKEIDEEEEYYFDNEEIPSDYEPDNKKEIKQREEHDDDYDEYNNDFENDKVVADLAKESNNNNVNLDDYKEMHESQKFEREMNFFDDTVNESSNIKNSSNIISSQQKNYLKQSEMLNDSYGNEIIKGLGLYHKMAFENDKSYN